MARDDGEVKLGAALVLGGITLVISGVKRFRQARRVQDHGTVPSASAPQGLVELQGFAWPTLPVTAPVSGMSCVYFSLHVEERRGSGKNSHWVTLLNDDTREPFFLADNSGHVLIRPHGAELEVRTREKSWRSLAAATRERILGMIRIKAPGFSDKALLTFKDIRVTERCIPAGSPLYALGDFRTSAVPVQSRPMKGLGAFVRKLRQIRSSAEALRLADQDRDGRISFEEWYRACNSLALHASGQTVRPDVSLPPGMEEASRCHGQLAKSPLHPLYLADCHQEELLHRIGRHNLLRIVGGCALIAVGLGVILRRIGVLPTVFG
jgi:hypothetical protein